MKNLIEDYFEYIEGRDPNLKDENVKVEDVY